MKPEEYVLTFNVPGPEEPGANIFFTALPDGRAFAVFVDNVRYGTQCVTAYRSNPPEDVITVPKEAPWTLVRRDLFQHRTRESVRQEQMESFKAELELATAIKQQNETGSTEQAAAGHSGVYL